MSRRFRKWRVHFLAECQECDWSTQDYENGPRQASRHAKRTGHLIHGEIGYAVRYNEGKVKKRWQAWGSLSCEKDIEEKIMLVEKPQNKEAIKNFLRAYAGDGWTIIKPEGLVKMGFTKEFVKKSTQTLNSVEGDYKNTIFDRNNKPVKNLKGVWSLTFHYAIAEDIGADTTEAHSKWGRGFQAQALVSSIKKKIGTE